MQGGSSKTIQTFLRVRPSKKHTDGFELDENRQNIQFKLKQKKEADYINNQRESFKFTFDRTFDAKTSQEEIFDSIAKEVIDDALNGYNGTIFAYGQTGSGKTYSMTGGGKAYSDRGIIPMTIEYIFDKKSRKTDGTITVWISYLQIYMEDGYNLLDSKQATTKITDLPKIAAYRDVDGKLVLKGISIHEAKSIDEAVQLLLIGELNREVAQTPKNDVSTRSHCIFTIRLEISTHGSSVKQHSEINLVDLSGSEQIKDRESIGDREKEAIAINLGLFYLERVILTLHEKERIPSTYVPFRDSLLTTVLQESIGGNCRTRMLATISSLEEDLRESISTCNFAMRVAMIKNTRVVNQSISPSVIIAELRRENKQLKAELERLTGPPREHLYPNEIEDIRQKIKAFVESEDASAPMPILDCKLKIDQCFYYFRQLARRGGGLKELKEIKGADSKEGAARGEESKGPSQTELQMIEEIKRLKLLVQLRDNQINILVQNLGKAGEGEYNPGINVRREGDDLIKSVVRQDRRLQMQAKEKQSERKQQKSETTMAGKAVVHYQAKGEGKPEQLSQVQSMLVKPINFSTQELKNREKVFEEFRKNYRRKDAINNYLSTYETKFEQGKVEGQKLKVSREKVLKLKKQLQDIRRQAMVAQFTNEGKEEAMKKEKLITLQLNQEKEQCKQLFEVVRKLRSQIEEIEAIVESNRIRLEKDFTKYYEVVLKHSTVGTATAIATAPEPSMVSGKTNFSSLKKQQLQKQLDLFYKARDQLHKL